MNRVLQCLSINSEAALFVFSDMKTPLTCINAFGYILLIVFIYLTNWTWTIETRIRYQRSAKSPVIQ